MSEEDIIMMVDAGSEQGAIEDDEKEFIKNVFEFNDITAREIALHRTKASILWCDDDIDTWEATIIEKRHTLYPVCEETIDNIVGVLNAKDFFALKDKSREKVFKAAVHPAYFVPETIKADDLFRDMKKTHNSMALVVDEYGGLVGILTLWDLAMELVGEIE